MTMAHILLHEPEPDEDTESLIEKSSLGTESAQAAIDSVSPEHGRRVAQMAEQRGMVNEPRITSEGGKRWHLTETEYVEFDAAGDIWINMGPHIKDARRAAAALLAAAEAEDDAAFAAMQGEYPPTPAEPAEEETKAEEELVAHRDGKGDIYVGHTLVAFKHRSYEQIMRWYHEAHPGGISERRYRAVLYLLNVEASSPVVPAPTETGPWQRIDDVPVGVPFIHERRTQLVKLADGKFAHILTFRFTAETLADLAPFVAAEER